MTVPAKITVHKRSKQVDINYPSTDESEPSERVQHYTLSAEYLRVHSPSAEVQRHGNPELQTGKKEVCVHQATIVGLYGVKFHFDDGHNTGIYTWPYLKSLCTNQEDNWNHYLNKLHAAGQTREKDASVVRFTHN